MWEHGDLEGVFVPTAGSLGRIEIYWPSIKVRHAWRRQAIALIAHEAVHLLEWNVVYHHNIRRWNGMPEPERWAEAVQDFILRLLGVRFRRRRALA